ncbi:uncharacterized protein [Anabrus simplex]|uniref:uncharacterized protein n=1 Tax=Anabrus simplex TaxID=316456 RepID=UPI0035A3BE90
MRNVKMMKYWVLILTIGTNIFPIMPAAVSTQVVNAEFQWIPEPSPPEITTTESPTAPPTTIDYCAFYNPVPGLQQRFLRLHTMEKNWEEARITCELESAFLAVPRSGQEIELYLDYVSRLRLYGGSTTDTWIGVRRNVQGGQLTTVQGDSLTYEQLNQSSPIPFYKWYDSGCWYLYKAKLDVDGCWKSKTFLCEKHNCW